MKEKKADGCSDDFATITADSHVVNFFTTIEDTMADGLLCICYQRLKRQELLLLLRAYCTKEELHKLLLPLTSDESDFRGFVIKHYKEVATVKEFASLANMSLRSFERHFKDEFSCPAHEWMTRRCAESILEELRTTNKDLSTISIENGFSSLSYFSSFCKAHLGSSPSELQKMYSAVNRQTMPMHFSHHHPGKRN